MSASFKDALWSSPSGGDKFYADIVFAANPDLPFLVLPIVDSVATDRPFQMRVFVATRHGDEIEVNRVPLHVVEMEGSIPEIAPPAETEATEEKTEPTNIKYEI